MICFERYAIYSIFISVRKTLFKVKKEDIYFIKRQNCNHIEASQLIFSENYLTRFNMIPPLAFSDKINTSSTTRTLQWILALLTHYISMFQCFISSSLENHFENWHSQGLYIWNIEFLVKWDLILYICVFQTKLNIDNGDFVQNYWTSFRH